MGSAWERLRGWFLVLDRLAGSFAKRGLLLYITEESGLRFH